ncbi:hypothetical protein [Ramlibacter tataouinensis]|uniref:Uncharacterized protein n=1 Tax=Ramlibacter tataouinensis (strain ATCC BAA-407 / DSM 14655 / LMG 21543 / TTB310) TaxID=365046 RepID=F5Y0D6_RAMTT|nr:hypothetical protein [Ramlibacter tataouinensis]AEG92158.1 hypothetical protein Rta_10730 [Ramlibacter tataouinensis TTB310]
MIPYDIDPSLHAAEPAPERLDDGFAPPAAQDEGVAPEPAPPQLALAAKSDF